MIGDIEMESQEDNKCKKINYVLEKVRANSLQCMRGLFEDAVAMTCMTVSD